MPILHRRLQRGHTYGTESLGSHPSIQRTLVYSLLQCRFPPFRLLLQLHLLLQLCCVPFVILLPLGKVHAGEGDLPAKVHQLPKPLFLFHGTLFLMLPMGFIRLRKTRLVLLVDGQGVEVLPLLGLGLDHLDDGDEVGGILGGLGPLRLGEQLVGETALDGAADTEDAVVTLLGVETGEGGLDALGLLGDKIIGPVRWMGQQSLVCEWY